MIMTRMQKRSFLGITNMIAISAVVVALLTVIGVPQARAFTLHVVDGKTGAEIGFLDAAAIRLRVDRR